MLRPAYVSLLSDFRENHPISSTPLERHKGNEKKLRPYEIIKDYLHLIFLRQGLMI